MKFRILCFLVFVQGILCVDAQINYTKINRDVLNAKKFRNNTISRVKGMSRNQAEHFYDNSLLKARELMQVLDGPIGPFEEMYCLLYHADPDSLTLEFKKTLRLMKSSGLEMREDGEGGCYADFEPYFFYSIFHKKVSPVYRDYLKLTADEDTVLFSGDAALGISFTDLGKRLINWERYHQRYPESPFTEEVKEKYNNYMSIYCFGMDNTPVFESAAAETPVRLNKINEDAFNGLIVKYPDTKTGSFIQTFLQILKADNYCMDPAVRENVMKKIPDLMK